MRRLFPYAAGEANEVDRIYTIYNIDGWLVQFPREWKMSLDREPQPPLVIFDVEEEPVTVYITTWGFERPETGEIPDADTVASFILHAFDKQGLKREEGFSEYYPEGFDTYIGRGVTAEGYTMISCALCMEGRALVCNVVCDESVDFEKYLRYIRSVKRDQE